MKISVLLPVYNREKFASQAIGSLVNQTLDNDEYEIIIINDGSTDGSQDIIDSYQAKHANIRAFKQENQGVIAVLNRGLELAKGEYITRLDDDDISHPTRLAKQYDYMLKHRLDLCGCFCEFIDKDSQVTGINAYPVKHLKCKDLLLKRNSVSIGGAMGMFKKDMVMEIGGFNPNFRDIEDLDLWLRIIERGGRLGNVPEYLYQYRMHDTNNTLLRKQEVALAYIVALYAYKFRVRGMKDGQDNGIDFDYLVKNMPDELQAEFQQSILKASDGLKKNQLEREQMI